MALAIAALAGPMPARAALVEANLNRVVGLNCSAETGLARPGGVALNWLADLDLGGAWKRPLAASAQQLQIDVAYRQLPLSFEANVGQSDPQVRFLARGPGYTLFLTASAEAVLVSRKGPPQVAHMGLAGANPRPDVRALEEQAAKSYYFIGNDPARWRSKVANYGRVRYQAVYPGIDLIYYGNQRQLEYDLVVGPGADPSCIQLSFPEARQLRVNQESGDLKLEEAGGEMCLHKPVAYQVVEGKRVAVEARYVSDLGNRVGLTLGPYDATRPLIIDPVLVYSTYLGGSGADLGLGVAVDAWGNAYVTGVTDSSDFPLAHPLPANSVLRGGQSGQDAFVSKLSFDARTATLSLVYSTYLGGSGDDSGTGIAADARGDVYVTGLTQSADFPLAHPLPTNSVFRGSPAFVSKLSFDARTATLSLAYSTYLGGSGGDFGLAIAVDAWGNAYVTGQSLSSDFPLVHPLPNNSVFRGFTAFVSKLSFDARTATLSLVYSTYLGGSTDDLGRGIAVDAWGNAYVTGITNSTDFPLVHPLPNSSAVREDAFVSKLSFDARTATLSLAYSTYLGGSGDDNGLAIAVDARGDAYVTGSTQSSDFPLVHPLPTNSFLRGSPNAFVSKLSFNGRSETLSLAYSTYLGGSGGDFGIGIAVDAWGNAYVTGTTGSSDFPLVHPLPTNSVFRGGFDDAFVSKLSFAGRSGTLSLAYSTYLGGSGVDAGRGIAVDAWGNAYVTGNTDSSDFPLAHPNNSTFRGSDDAFVAKIAQ